VIISGAQLSVTAYFDISEGSLSQGMVLGSAAIGCMFGPFLGMFLCDAIGRRRTLLISALLFGASAIGTALPNDLVTFNVFRAVGGLGIGLASVASPMYIVEVAPPKWRGALGLMFQLAVCIGALAAVVVAYYLALRLPDDINWRWMFASEMVAILGLALALMFVPHSPRWLAEKGRHDEAFAVMSRISGAERAGDELSGIMRSLEAGGRNGDRRNEGVTGTRNGDRPETARNGDRGARGRKKRGRRNGAEETGQKKRGHRRNEGRRDEGTKGRINGDNE